MMCDVCRPEYEAMVDAMRKCHHKLELERGRQDARGTIPVAGIGYRVIASDSVRGYMAVALSDPAIADLPAFPAPLRLQLELREPSRPLPLPVGSSSADCENGKREKRATREEVEYYEGDAELDDDTIDAATGLTFGDLRALDLQPGSIRALEYDADVDVDLSAAARVAADDSAHEFELGSTRNGTRRGVTFLTDFEIETPAAARSSGRPPVREDMQRTKPSAAAAPKVPQNSSNRSQQQLASLSKTSSSFERTSSREPAAKSSRSAAAAMAQTAGALSQRARGDAEWEDAGKAEAQKGVDGAIVRSSNPFARHSQWAQAREERAGYSLCVSRSRVVVGFHGAHTAPAACNYRVMLLGDFVRLVLNM